MKKIENSKWIEIMQFKKVTNLSSSGLGHAFKKQLMHLTKLNKYESCMPENLMSKCAVIILYGNLGLRYWIGQTPSHPPSFIHDSLALPNSNS